MEIIRGLHNLQSRHHGSVVTIGNFDGVHRGHQAVLRQVREKAVELDVQSMLICFEPQPKEYFDVFNAPARLTRFREKVELLAEHGVDLVLCMKFDKRSQTQSAKQFMALLFIDIKASAIFVGDDFKFGHDRSGDFQLLRNTGETTLTEVTNMYTLTVDEKRVSSTRIRECLAEGEFILAESLLGHPYSISGKVVYGNQFGRTMGVPTINVQLHRDRAPISGSYAVEVYGLEEIYQGVANVGVRPTLDEKTLKPILEVHIFDFDRDIYGQQVKVRFLHKIRDEIKFPDLHTLKVAIYGDIEKAQLFFKSAA